MPESGRRVLVKMNTVDDKAVLFSDEDGIGYHANADEGVEFEFIPVTKRLFVHKDTLCLVQRQPARMWARGINSQNTNVQYVSSRYNPNLSFPIIKAAFLEDHDLQLGKKAYVLSDAFGVDDGILYVYNSKIGTMNAEAIRLDSTLFKQEVLDLLRQHRITREVSIG